MQFAIKVGGRLVSGSRCVVGEAITTESESKVCRHVIFNEYRDGEAKGMEGKMGSNYDGIGTVIIIV